MVSLSKSFRTLWDALFLQPEAYATMRDDDNPFVEGLFLLAVLGVILAISAVIGTTLEWATSPSLADVQTAVLAGLQQMDWWQQLEQFPEAMQQFRLIWDQIWQGLAFAAPRPAFALINIVSKPLSLILGWLVYGVIGFATARLLGGRGTLNQTLGATALAAAPQILNLATSLPYVAVAGIGAWTLLCSYMALRVVHHLSWPRAVIAAVVPWILLVVVAAGIIGGLSVLFGAVFGSTMVGG